MSHDTQPAKDQARRKNSCDLRDAMIAELQNLEAPHVSLACPDCAEDAWDFVVEMLAEAGYRIVPIEATEAMLRQGSAALYPPSRDFADECWRAMVRAAGDEGVARTREKVSR